MIEDVVSVFLPVTETLKIRKNHLEYGKGKKKKRISIVTGIHGDELEGQYVCYELFRRIQEHLDYLDGIVDIYPAMNPLGIDSIERGIPAFDLDMNRVFPGNEEGSMTEHVAAKIIEELMNSDLVIDIHASNIFLTEIPQVRINELHEKLLIPYANKLNVDLIWVHGSSTVLESTLAYSLNSRNTPTLVVEMGVGMRITREYGDQLVEGILSVMRYMEIWSGPAEKSIRTPMIAKEAEDVCFLNAPAAGIFISSAEHGDYLEQGEKIGVIIDPLQGCIRSRIIATVSGILFTRRDYPVVNEGSLIARILKRDGKSVCTQR
ncbi:MAG: M14 family metallopeptidase [Lachnospiraceae bacterium]|nr:M14 family metallopeptidase [Lachnospiraceae bacterium]